MSESKRNTINYTCQFCGKRQTKFFRRDLKYKFCSRTCNSKSRINKLNDRDRTGSKNPAWKGGVITNRWGYVLVYKPNHPYHNYKKTHVFEHRLVVEQKIGRVLTKDEVVHHINHNKKDNRPENLKILSKTEHHKEHSYISKMGYEAFINKKVVIKCLECGKEEIAISPATKYCIIHRRKPKDYVNRK